jgi:hypothetical protein
MGPKPGVDTAEPFHPTIKRPVYPNNFKKDFRSKFQMVEHYGINPKMLLMKFDEDDKVAEIASESPLYRGVEIPKAPTDVEPDDMMKYHESVKKLQSLQKELDKRRQHQETLIEGQIFKRDLGRSKTREDKRQE